MTSFQEFLNELQNWIPFLLLLTDLVILAGCIPWVLMTKSNSASAVAWILLLVFLPFAGFILFLLFGYQHVHRNLKKKRRHRAAYQIPPDPADYEAAQRNQEQTPEAVEPAISLGESLARLAYQFGAHRVTAGNKIDFHYEGQPTFSAMLADIRAAQHHVHLEFYIFQPDTLGREFLDLLTQKAREGVEVRLLYDAMGSSRMRNRLLKPLRQAGGRTSVFLPINPLRRRIQINMRNHRKILVVDGVVGYVGGLNIGDEYRCMDPCYGYWRDAHLRLEGPAVTDLQRVFAEDWSFSAAETLSDVGRTKEKKYYQVRKVGGPYPLQILDSGPDKDVKALRELYFAAILRARRRVWIASPYFVPDEGLLDALRLACLSGLDVRFLGQCFPDQRVPMYAARYYWTDMLKAGMKIYQFVRGMMHSKILLVDDDFAVVGTANLDNRSMYLNFEVSCLIYSAQGVQELEKAMVRDFADSILVDPAAFAQRPFAGRLLENACRLLSPVL